jgi:hypothetical protein
MTGHIAHHSARSLVFALPAPGSQDKRTPLPWDPAQPFKGLGWRKVEADREATGQGVSGGTAAGPGEAYTLTEFSVVRT